MHPLRTLLTGRWRANVILLLVLPSLLALPMTAVAAPAVSVTPASVVAGGVIRVRATGLAAATTYLVQLVAGTGNVNTVRLIETPIKTDANGTLTTTLTLRHVPGPYTVRVVAGGGTIIALTPLTISPGGSPRPPGLPRTGDGGLPVVDLPPNLPTFSSRLTSLSHASTALMRGYVR